MLSEKYPDKNYEDIKTMAIDKLNKAMNEYDKFW